MPYQIYNDIVIQLFLDYLFDGFRIGGINGLVYFLYGTDTNESNGGE